MNGWFGGAGCHRRGSDSPHQADPLHEGRVQACSDHQHGGEEQLSTAGRRSRPRPRHVLCPPPEGAQGESPRRPAAGGAPRWATRGPGPPQVSTSCLQPQARGGQLWQASARSWCKRARSSIQCGGPRPVRRSRAGRAVQAGRSGRYPPTGGSARPPRVPRLTGRTARPQPGRGHGAPKATPQIDGSRLHRAATRASQPRPHNRFTGGVRRDRPDAVCVRTHLG
ncbi:hypothetical protein NDU88_002165 [Pleurodeles waltl]|uniref:Uncharacterized protein n=1 Tax=Pleurodeles waltl TaxID=8319 RepID=A0AAV7UCE9_PLEWA|nr:hypothetical protein NDU88_002165 [Pleurodeles waltl]